MLLPIVLLLLFAEPRILTCTVVEPDKSVACEEPTGPMVWTISGSPGTVSIWDEWRLVAPLQDGGVNADAPLSRTNLVKGQKVKARIENGELLPIADCKVRVWRNIKEWRRGREGEPLPLMVRTEPDDCQPWYGSQSR